MRSPIPASRSASSMAHGLLRYIAAAGSRSESALKCERSWASLSGETIRQISSMPDSMASSTMIWIVGLVVPSRSTSGISSFWRMRVAGKWRVPRPAAVMTAFFTRVMRSRLLQQFRQQAMEHRLDLTPQILVCVADPGNVGTDVERRGERAAVRPGDDHACLAGYQLARQVVRMAAEAEALD